MHDDDVIDQLLRDAMAADVPQLSSAFDIRVMRRVRPRRLTPMGRLVLGVYVVGAAAAALWLMRDLRMEWMAAAVAIGAPLAAAASAYVRRLAVSH